MGVGPLPPRDRKGWIINPGDQPEDPHGHPPMESIPELHRQIESLQRDLARMRAEHSNLIAFFRAAHDALGSPGDADYHDLATPIRVLRQELVDARKLIDRLSARFGAAVQACAFMHDERDELGITESQHVTVEGVRALKAQRDFYRALLQQIESVIHLSGCPAVPSAPVTEGARPVCDGEVSTAA